MGRCLYLAVIAASFVFSLQADVSSWQSKWTAFRQAYPYHIQAVAVSQPNSDGNRLLILSEPPPGIKPSDIYAIDPKSFGEMSLPRQRIGFDGWVQDAAIELKPMGEAQLSELVDKIHLRLFGTAYKAVAIGIPERPELVNRKYAFDLRVSAGTLKRWLLPEPVNSSKPLAWLGLGAILGLLSLGMFGPKRGIQHGLALVLCLVTVYFGASGFTHYRRLKAELISFDSPQGGTPRTCGKLLSDKAQGLFYSTNPGLLLWILSRQDPLDLVGREARRFALDSDIILGSVANDSRVAIVGRERVAPINVLPPLRTETIMQLASVKDSELAQSYERTHVFAGKFDGVDDWAPIYLSDSLIDTEYGSLLNITDQLLKSWSMRGKIRYVNFNYPDPTHFPFPKPLLSMYANTHRVTFNWNTKGAGYSSAFGPLDIFAWTRTGALPVDYLGSSDTQLRSAEDTGYEYFAGLSDPNLVRVVQYAVLYQIFKRYGIGASEAPVDYHASVPPIFKSQLAVVFRRLASSSDSHIESQKTDSPQKLVQCSQVVSKLEQEADPTLLNSFISAVAAPRLFMRQATNDEQKVGEVAIACGQAFQSVQDLADMNLAQIFETYVRFAQHETANWVHTPSVVISKPSADLAGVTGGHNLDAAATALRATSELRSGQLKVIKENGQQIVEYSESDADRIQQIVRPLAREEDTSTSNLEAKAREALASAKTDMRPLSDTLGFAKGESPAEARGFQMEQAPAESQQAGWWESPQMPTTAQGRLITALSATHLHALVIERNPAGGYVVLDGPKRAIINAATKPGAIDAVLALTAKGEASQEVHLHFLGFQPKEAKGFVETAELQLEGTKETPRIRASVVEEDYDPQKLKTLLAEGYNFKKITIREAAEQFVTEDGRNGVHFDVDCASISTGKPSLLVRITIVLKQGLAMTQELMASLREAISSAFALQQATTADDSVLMTSAFVRALAHINPNIDYVEAKVSKEGKDFYLVLNPDVRGRVQARHAG